MLKKAFFYWNVLSIDIVLGALASALFVSTLLETTMRTAFWFLLPTAVWIIYTADHLFDGWKLGETSVNLRHKFHYDNLIFLSILTGILAVLCFIFSILFLREWIVTAGLILGIFVFFHVLLSYLQLNFFWKECSVSILYTAGVWFGPFLLTTKTKTEILIPCLLFLLAALCNSFMNSYMERELDQKENVESILKQISPRALKRCVFALASLGLGTNLYWLVGNPKLIPEFLYFCFGSLIPAWIVYRESYFQKNQFYRIFGEGYFILSFLPVIVRKWILPF
ncbi:LA_0991 family prenyltransferase-like protein [Leptospira tipperaryensis]|uniref:LA_0991 family prenyltransferase-like protein n=1 Tax=Leptospira tipperaryensis TaxID=2564040 RepID=UPI00156AFE4C|nr:hypothetical protein [Leptospira tipperaryensis]